MHLSLWVLVYKNDPSMLLYLVTLPEAKLPQGRATHVPWVAVQSGTFLSFRTPHSLGSLKSQRFLEDDLPFAGFLLVSSATAGNLPKEPLVFLRP